MSKSTFESGAPANSTSRREWIHRWSRLGLALVLLGTFWLCVLPQIARIPAVRAHRQWLDQRGINPSAMYYTELEVMKTILSRQEAGTSEPE